VTHPLAGHFSVEASARLARSYRYAEERMMRTLGGWIALTPELPVKLLFGRHVWECAQHADAWGRRLPELRARAHESQPSSDAFVRFMDLLDAREAPEESPERVVGVYRVLKPHLVATYASHLDAANATYEPPTRRILERCLVEERRHAGAGAVLLGRLLKDEPARARVVAWEAELASALAEAGGVTGETPVPPRALEVSGLDLAGDLVALDSVFDPGVIDPALRGAVEAHAAAVAAGDLDLAATHIEPAARREVLALCAAASPARRWEIRAQAKVGGHRLVKVALSGARGTCVLLLQWRQQGPGPWRVFQAEVVRTLPAG
jgi:hypothetical protein